MLCAQSDASWSTTADGKGFNSHLIKLWGSVIAWKTVKQKLTALSSAEAEIMALVQCIMDLIWIRGLLVEIGIPTAVDYPIKINTDSQAVINTVCSLGVSPRTKHYRRLVSFVKDEVDRGNVLLCYSEGKTLTADLLTKIFPGGVYKDRVKELGIVEE
jgi:hypothetical protein